MIDFIVHSLIALTILGALVVIGAAAVFIKIVRWLSRP